MGYRQFSFKLPTSYDQELLKKRIRDLLKIREFSFQIENKALDARKKSDIHWQIRVLVTSDELKGDGPEPLPELKIPYRKRKEKVVVVGSGPAGFFAALVLQKAGFQTTLLERGQEVEQRARRIQAFESTGIFDPMGNYAFGEGGAGTFSDGKLTSRSKHISFEKPFILNAYVEAGGPPEIRYMTHPHLGSDLLRTIVKKLRLQFLELGGIMLFETRLNDIIVKNGNILEAVTQNGNLDASYFVIAPGHSAYETYRMLMKRGVPFRTKNFALGSRMEHSQELINKAQWGIKKLPGVKAAEYRLTSKGTENHPVYSFCMCPGGVIVPATAYENQNIVNGMSRYRRDEKFANAACVAGINLNQFLAREVSASESLDWLEKLEQRFYDLGPGYKAPYCSLQNFIEKKLPSGIPESSYPMGLTGAPLWEYLPDKISTAMRVGLENFSRKIKGFETGNIMGLESKTSAPIQVLRDENRRTAGIENLYLAGEGSGYTGGIMSSAADGIKVAMDIIRIER